MLFLCLFLVIFIVVLKRCLVLVLSNVVLLSLCVPCFIYCRVCSCLFLDLLIVAFVVFVCSLIYLQSCLFRCVFSVLFVVLCLFCLFMVLIFVVMCYLCFRVLFRFVLFCVLVPRFIYCRVVVVVCSLFCLLSRSSICVPCFYCSVFDLCAPCCVLSWFVFV